MKRVLLAAAAALALTAPAAAFEFDNSTCKEFLAGTWNGSNKRTAEGQTAEITTHSVYNADGTFTSSQTLVVNGGTPESRDIKGLWDATSGPEANSCKASLTPDGSGTMIVVLRIIDENTVEGPEGGRSVREAS